MRGLLAFGVARRVCSRIASAVASFPLQQQTLSAYSTSERLDCIIIGAGVVGLACARALAISGKEVLLVDSASIVGTETSARHSEVIHAGIYYPAGSLKAKLCVEGKHMLYDYCQQKEIPHKCIGKLIVATARHQKQQMLDIMFRSHINGVSDLCLLDKTDIASIEPSVKCIMALLSPSTGIIDSHSYMHALQADFERAGGTLALNTSFITGNVTDAARKEVTLQDKATGEAVTLQCRQLVNAAGLWAQAVSSQLQGLPSSTIPSQYLAKGNYFTIAGKVPFNRLIYPIPEDGGLGVHVTLDLAGQARFGPDVQWMHPSPPTMPTTAPTSTGEIDATSAAKHHLPLGQPVDYSVDPSRGQAFYAAIRKYYPDLQDGALQPAYSGIRPKLSGPSQAAADFMVQGGSSHGVAGLVNLYGIESPGLTSSLAIAQLVQKMLA